MALVDHSQFDATSQLLEFAERGRLVTRLHSRSDYTDMSPLPIVVVASAMIGLGIAILVAGLDAGRPVVVAMGGGATLASLAMLLPALSALRQHNEPETTVDIRAAAVVAPRSVKPGNWIQQDDAWVRVDEAGHGHNGCVTALLSTGAVIELSHPITVAGGPFSPSESHDGPGR